jgi:hypothetical protein
MTGHRLFLGKPPVGLQPQLRLGGVLLLQQLRPRPGRLPEAAFLRGARLMDAPRLFLLQFSRGLVYACPTSLPLVGLMTRTVLVAYHLLAHRLQKHNRPCLAALACLQEANAVDPVQRLAAAVVEAPCRLQVLLLRGQWQQLVFTQLVRSLLQWRRRRRSV